MRVLAARKRDQAIKQAQIAFDLAITEIDALEAKLTPQRALEPITAIIIKTAPNDRAFTIDECLAFVYASDPKRQFTRATVRKSLYRLFCRGSIKQVGTGKDCTYALLDTNVGGRSLADCANSIQNNTGRELRPIEILVAMREQGVQLECRIEDATRYVDRKLK